MELQIFWNGAYWNPISNSWTGTVVWATAAVAVPNVTASSWTFTNLPSAAQWTHGDQYTVLSRAKDSALTAGNTQQIFTVTESSFNFKWDNLPPETSITSPSEGAKIFPTGANWQISGQVTDSPANTALGNIDIQLSYLDGGNTMYWDGSSAWFQNDPSKVFTPTVYTNPVWYYNMPVNKLVSDRAYVIKIKASDNASPANPGSFPAAAGSSYVGVVIDTTPPVSQISYPKTGNYYRPAVLTTLSGTANADLSGAKKVEVEIRHFNGSSWDILRSFRAANKTSGTDYGTINWSTGTAGITWVSGEQYAVESKAYDWAGSTQVAVSSVTFTVDEQGPNLAMAQPSTDNSYWNTLLTISGTASDDISASISSVTVAVYNIDTLRYWDPSSGEFDSAGVIYTTAALSLPDWTFTGFGAKLKDNNRYYVYAKAYDAPDNNTSLTSGVVYFDTTTPTAQFKSPGPASGNYYQNISQITGTAIEAGANSSKVDTVRVWIINPTGPEYWEEGVGWSGVEKSTYAIVSPSGLSVPFNWNASNVTWSEGVSYRVEVKSKDRALKSDDGTYTGNWQVTASSVGFTIDRTTPTYTVSFPGNNNKYNAIANIRGSFSETVSGKAYMQIVIKGDFGGKVYWDEPTLSWKTQTELEGLTRWPPWTDVSVYQDSWSYTTSVDYATTNNSRWHKAWIRVGDNAGNYKSPSAADIENNVSPDVSFMFDSERPVSYISTFYDGRAINSQVATTTGTTTDVNAGSGVTDIKIRVRRDDGQYWQEPGWGSAIWLPKTSLSVPDWVWTTANPEILWEDNHKYYFNTMAFDAATNS